MSLSAALTPTEGENAAGMQPAARVNALFIIVESSRDPTRSRCCSLVHVDVLSAEWTPLLSLSLTLSLFLCLCVFETNVAPEAHGREEEEEEDSVFSSPGTAFLFFSHPQWLSKWLWDRLVVDGHLLSHGGCCGWLQYLDTLYICCYMQCHITCLRVETALRCFPDFLLICCPWSHPPLTPVTLQEDYDQM